jgi:hypothetical protein
MTILIYIVTICNLVNVIIGFDALVLQSETYDRTAKVFGGFLMALSIINILMIL